MTCVFLCCSGEGVVMSLYYLWLSEVNKNIRKKVNKCTLPIEKFGANIAYDVLLIS